MPSMNHDEFICRLPQGQPRTFQRGEHLFRQGEASTSLFLVTAGNVYLYKENHNPQDSTRDNPLGLGLKTVTGKRPTLIGLETIPEEAQQNFYPNSAQAITDVEANAINHTSLLHKMTQDPEVAIELLRLIAGEIKERRRKLLLISYGDLSLRITTVLSQLADNLGVESSDGVHINGLTRTQIAHLSGCTRNGLNIHLQRMEADGVVTRGDIMRKINVTNLKQLQQLVGESESPITSP